MEQLEELWKQQKEKERGEDRKLSVSALSNLLVVSINYLVIKLNTNNNNSMKLAYLFLL